MNARRRPSGKDSASISYELRLVVEDPSAADAEPSFRVLDTLFSPSVPCSLEYVRTLGVLSAVQLHLQHEDGVLVFRPCLDELDVVGQSTDFTAVLHATIEEEELETLRSALLRSAWHSDSFTPAPAMEEPERQHG